MKRRVLWMNIGLAVVLVAGLVGGYFALFHTSTEATTGRTVAAQQGSLQATVTASGTVETAGTVSLSFQSSGIVTAVDVNAGDTVRAGQPLVSIDDTSARQQLASAKGQAAQAAASSAQTSLQLSQAQRALKLAKKNAKLNKQSYNAAVTSSAAKLAEAQQAWSTECLDSSATGCPSTEAWSQMRTAEAAVTNAQRAYEQAMSKATMNETTLNLQVNQAAINLAQAHADQSTACASDASSTACKQAGSQVTQAQQSYDSAVNNRTVSLASDKMNLQNLDAQVTAANVSLRQTQASMTSNAATSVRTAQESYNSAVIARAKGIAADESSVSNAQTSLASLQASSATIQTAAGPTSAQQAAVESAQIGVEVAKAALDETTLVAPVAGTVAAVNATVGEIAGGSSAATDAASSVVTIVPDGEFQVVAAFSEADAIQVQIGQEATVTFDALPDASATGVVTAVDAVATTSSSLVTYGVTLSVEGAPEELRNGMTATVAVIVDSVDDAVWVPATAVTTTGGVSTVTIRKDGVDTVTTVEVGLVGDNGTQVLSGVGVGDELVVNDVTSDSSSGFPSMGMPGGLGGGASFSFGGGARGGRG